jgi:hypothetical protein
MNNYIQFILEDEEVKKYISHNEEVIGYIVQKLPTLSNDIIYYVKNNKKEFIGKDLKETRENIILFTEDIVVDYLNFYIMLLNEDISTTLSKFSNAAGKGVQDLFVNPITTVVGKVHSLSWLTSGLISMFSGGNLFDGGIIGSIWSHFYKTTFNLEMSGAPLLASSSVLLLASMMVFFIILRVLSGNESISIYNLVSNLNDFVNKLKLFHNDPELNKIKLERNILKGFKVDAFSNCEKSKNCLNIKDNNEKKYCMLDCFFDFFINEELSIIIKSYLIYLKSINTNIANINSFSDLLRSPLKEEQEIIKISANKFINSLYDVLHNLYKNKLSNQHDIINKLNKLTSTLDVITRNPPP